MTNPIEYFRTKNNVTLQALADAIGVHKTTIMRWENGSVLVPPSRLADVEKATGISRKKLRPDIFEGVK